MAEKVTAEKEFEITTTAQVERTYVVKGDDDEQAHRRLRTWLADPDGVREGLVVELPERQTDTTTQKVKEKKELTKPRAVESTDAASAAGGAK